MSSFLERQNIPTQSRAFKKKQREYLNSHLSVFYPRRYEKEEIERQRQRQNKRVYTNERERKNKGKIKEQHYSRHGRKITRAIIRRAIMSELEQIVYDYLYSE